MTAVESIFLTGGENVRGAVGRRLARCAAETHDDRVRVIGIFTNVYNTRSQNFHFLEPVEESGELPDFFQIVFQAIVKLVLETNVQQTKDDYIAELKKQ